MMLTFYQIDAFTKVPYNGNPCAVVFDADHLSAQQMQKIALEMNLSETAFVMASDKADIRARYFTPSFEIPLAGHPTIATIYALLQRGTLVPSSVLTTIRLELLAGVIEVDIEIDQHDTPRITMSQLPPDFLRHYSAAEVMPAFGLQKKDLLPGASIQTVSTGTPQLMIPLISHESLRKASLQIDKYRPLLANGDFFSPHLFVTEGATNEGQTFARHFGLPPDTYEDPFTGSATGGMAAYLWHYHLIDKSSFVAEQGHWMGRPGEALVEVIGEPSAIKTVRVGGNAVMVMQGQLIVPD